MPIAKVFFGMSLKRDEGDGPQAVVERESVMVREGLLEVEEDEDVQLGQRRKSRRHHATAGIGGKMRLRGKLGGRKIRGYEDPAKREAEKAAKKLERKELVLALKLSRKEYRREKKAEKSLESSSKRGRKSRSESRNSRTGASKSPASCHTKKESRRSIRKSSELRHLKTDRPASRTVRAVTSKPSEKESKRSIRKQEKDARRSGSRSKSAEPRHPKTDRSSSYKEKGFIRRRRDAKRSRSRSQSKGSNEPIIILKVKLTPEEKLAKKQARKEIREAKKAAKEADTPPAHKIRNAKRVIFSAAPKNPFRPKIRFGKLVHAPKAFKSMRAAAQRR